jgi:hypothetical protein
MVRHHPHPIRPLRLLQWRSGRQKQSQNHKSSLVLSFKKELIF